jgi:hypothetical protein
VRGGLWTLVCPSYIEPKSNTSGSWKAPVSAIAGMTLSSAWAGFSSALPILAEVEALPGVDGE